MKNFELTDTAKMNLFNLKQLNEFLDEVTMELSHIEQTLDNYKEDVGTEEADNHLIELRDAKEEIENKIKQK